MKAYFQAIFYVDKEDNSWVNVKIVDILAAFTCGIGYNSAVFYAQDCVKCMLGSNNVLHHVSTYERTKKLCNEGDWIELIEIDLPKQTIQKEKIFFMNKENYFPSAESKLENDRIKEANLKKCISKN